MGNLQSSLHIYLGKKDGKYNIPGHYNIKITKSYSNTCCNYLAIGYGIKYEHKRKKDIILRYGYYNLTLCLGTGVTDVGEKIFTFYPQLTDHIVKWVTVIYSVFHPEKPLFVIFTTRKKINFNFIYGNLTDKKYAYSSDLDDILFKQSRLTGYTQEFDKLFGNNKLKLIADSQKNNNFSSLKQNVGDGTKFSKIIFTSKVPVGNIGITELLSPIPRGLTKNLLDPYYLNSFNNKPYDGILVYYSKEDIVLALEFDTGCKDKKHIVKKDKYGTHWEDKNLSFRDDNKLIQELESIESQSSKNEIVTFILDLKKKYNEVVVENDNEKKTYYSYVTHKNTGLYTSKKSRLVMTQKEFTQTGLSADTVYEQISVYYLKHKEKGDDKDPFLIKFTEKKPGDKWYYSEATFSSGKWKVFSHGSPELAKRLDKIEQNGNCAEDIPDLRKKAYKILEEPAPKQPAPTTPKEPAPTTPKEPAPTTPAAPPNIPLIAGSTAGAVGGTAILGAGGYGYYLYATTIKLLT